MATNRRQLGGVDFDAMTLMLYTLTNYASP